MFTLIGVSNGTVQFMAYNKLKPWRFEQKQRQFVRAGKTTTPEDNKLVCIPRVDVHLANDSLLPSHTVKHSLYHLVWWKQVVCACNHIFTPSHSCMPTSVVHLLLSIPVSHVLSDHTEYVM